jgi:hypothetical protein
MNDAQLHLCLRKDIFNRLRKPTQAIHTHHVNIFDAAIPQFGQNA